MSSLFLSALVQLMPFALLASCGKAEASDSSAAFIFQPNSTVCIRNPIITMFWRIHHDNCHSGGNSCRRLAIDESSTNTELYGERQSAAAGGVCSCVANCMYDCNVTITTVRNNTNGTTTVDVTLNLFVSQSVIEEFECIFCKVSISGNSVLSNHTCLEHQPSTTTTPPPTTPPPPVRNVTTTHTTETSTDYNGTDVSTMSSSSNLFYIMPLFLILMSTFN